MHPQGCCRMLWERGGCKGGEAKGGWVPQKQGFKDTGNLWLAFQIEMCMPGTAR